MLYSIIRSEQDTRTFLYLMSSNWFNSSSRSLTAEVISSQVISRYLVHLWRSQLTAISWLRRFYKEVTVLLLSWFCVSRESTHQLFFYVQHVGGFSFWQLPNIVFPSSPLVFLVQSWTARDRLVLTLCEICAVCLNQRALFLQVLLSGETQEEWMRWAANQSEAIWRAAFLHVSELCKNTI